VANLVRRPLGFSMTVAGPGVGRRAWAGQLSHPAIQASGRRGMTGLGGEGRRVGGRC